jgi:hypothetical protein
MEPKFYLLFATALIPMAVGFVYYHHKMFGKQWMAAAGLTEELVKGGNMALILGLTYLFGLFISAALMGIVIHQMGLFSMLQDDPNFKDPNSPNHQLFLEIMKIHGHSFRTFKHGVFHGIFAGITFALPIISINALFERRSFKYVAIHAGYWIITLAIMGGVICHFL